MSAENGVPRDDPSYLLVFCEPLLENGFQSWCLTKQKTLVGFESGNEEDLIKWRNRMISIFPPIADCDIVLPKNQDYLTNEFYKRSFEVHLKTVGGGVRVRSTGFQENHFKRLLQSPDSEADRISFDEGSFEYVCVRIEEGDGM